VGACAHSKPLLIFPSPVRRLDNLQTSGGLGEDCLSAQREFRSPACLQIIEGTAQRRRTGGDFFGLLFLARPELCSSRTTYNNQSISHARHVYFLRLDILHQHTICALNHKPRHPHSIRIPFAFHF
jgi:hypothetical protein